MPTLHHANASKQTESPSPCPLCGADSVVLFSCHALPIQKCILCNHQFTIPVDPETHIDEVYNDDYFFGGGAGYDDYLAEQELLIQRGRDYADLLRKYGKPGRVLDIGSAAGFLLRGLIGSGWQGTGIEPNKKLSIFAEEEMQIDSVCASLDTFEGKSTYELVTMVQVVAHLIDPISAFKKVHSLLEPEGLLLIETWDRNSLAARLLGSRWHEYSPPSVLHWFAKADLSELLSQCGFEVLATGRPRRKIQVGHAKSLVRYKYGKLAAAPLAWLPDRLALPYPADDLFWMLVRRSHFLPSA